MQRAGEDPAMGGTTSAKALVWPPGGQPAGSMKQDE